MAVQSVNSISSFKRAAPTHLTTAFSSKRLHSAGIRALVGSVLAVIAIWGAVLQPAAPVQAGNACNALRCVFACNKKTHLCSRFPASRVPRGYKIESNAPPGFKIVRSKTTCDNRLCLDRSKSICSTIPIGQ